jgi:hypothetical protein
MVMNIAWRQYCYSIDVGGNHWDDDADRRPMAVVWDSVDTEAVNSGDPTWIVEI